MGPDLGTEAEPESAVGCLGQLPRGRGGHHRAAGKGDGHAREQIQARGHGRGHCRGQIGRPAGLGQDEAGESGPVGGSNEVRHPPKRDAAGHQVEAHRSRSLPGGPNSQEPMSRET